MSFLAVIMMIWLWWEGKNVWRSVIYFGWRFPYTTISASYYSLFNLYHLRILFVRESKSGSRGLYSLFFWWRKLTTNPKFSQRMKTNINPYWSFGHIYISPDNSVCNFIYLNYKSTRSNLETLYFLFSIHSTTPLVTYWFTRKDFLITHLYKEETNLWSTLLHRDPPLSDYLIF